MGKFHIKSGPKVLAYPIYHAMRLLKTELGSKVNPTSAQCVVESIQSLNFRFAHSKQNTGGPCLM